MNFIFFIADDELPVVTPSSIDPALLKRYNELYAAITRARKDKKKKYGFFRNCFVHMYYLIFVFTHFYLLLFF